MGPTLDSRENFHTEAAIAERERREVERPKIFLIDKFQPATDRLLLQRLPAPEEGLIVRPEIATEQSEYGYVVAIGDKVDVPVGVIAKFSKYSGPEDIHFDDEEPGDQFVLVYKHDIRGWLVLTEEEIEAAFEGKKASDVA